MLFRSKNKNDYVLLIDKAIVEQSAILTNARKDFAKSHTWEKSVQEIYKAINSLQIN